MKTPHPFKKDKRCARAALALLTATVAGSLMAATYYVDFEGGDDAADGTSPATAWKRAPGDRKAEGSAKGAKLNPGDVVILKGGVQYRGEIVWNFAGEEGAPIVLDGNSAGTFGAGRAILDGSQAITGWQKCISQEQAGGNPRWQEIMYTDLDVDLTSNFETSLSRFVVHRDAGAQRQAPWQRLFLIDGEKRLLPIAMQPKPSDNFYPDRPGDFFRSPHRMEDNYPHKVYYEEGSRGNNSLPVLAIVYGGSAPVIQPFDGGAVSIDLAAPVEIAELGFTLFRPKQSPVPEQIIFSIDDKEVLTVDVDRESTKPQRFALPQKTTARKLTYRLKHSNPGNSTWTKMQRFFAYTPEGENILDVEIATIIKDEERLTGINPADYEGLFLGVHGGNSHTFFSRIRKADPATGRLEVPHFTATTYDHTSYALYNSPRFIEQPGEWCLAQLEGGRTRVFLLPDRLENGQPVDIGYPVLATGIQLNGASAHLEVRNFLIQRYAGGAGAISTSGGGGGRPHHINVADCEVRFISGHAGVSLNMSDHVTVKNCHIHHCPGWTVGIYVNRVNDYEISENRLVKNAGSGIRHYEAKRGVLRGNAVLDHLGMHSSGVNFYEGCADILFEDNFVHNTMTINRNAENIILRNNVVDGMNKSAVCLGIWTSGSVGGRQVRNIQFINNTFVNTNKELYTWATGILAQARNSPGRPQGLVIRNNVLDGLAEHISGDISGNIFVRKGSERFMSDTCQIVEDKATLFMDPDKGDYRRRPGGPLPEAGANLTPPEGL